MRESRRQGTDQLLFAASFAALACLVLVIGGALLYRSRLHYQINYNEGWNSYFADRILQNLPLYPDRSTRLINNYPPLSFAIVAAVAKLTGSMLVAGRAVAWCGFFSCATLIALLLRSMGCTVAGALYGGLFFPAVLVTRFDLYVGMFDPQLLGQALMLTGLLVLIRREDRIGAVLCAALVVGGGFVKHSLIALPISTTLWLAWYRPRLLVPWLLAGIGLAAAGLAACVALFGPEFVAGLTEPRRVDAADALRKVLRWLLPLELPCALATLPLMLGGAYSGFVGVYLIVALVAGVAGAAPLATNYNMIFELLVAVSLGLGLLVGRPLLRVPVGWVALAGAASLWVGAFEAATAQTTSWTTWSAVQRARDAKAVAEIAAIRDAPGPALCGTLLLCFQAGKPLLFDPLNYGQAPGETQQELIMDIVNKGLAIIQIDPANLYFSNATLEAIRGSYREIPEDPDLRTPLR